MGHKKYKQLTKNVKLREQVSSRDEKYAVVSKDGKVIRTAVVRVVRSTLYMT